MLCFGSQSIIFFIFDMSVTNSMGPETFLFSDNTDWSKLIDEKSESLKLLGVYQNNIND